jgi:hypothetical protein
MRYGDEEVRVGGLLLCMWRGVAWLGNSLKVARYVGRLLKFHCELSRVKLLQTKINTKTYSELTARLF